MRVIQYKVTLREPVIVTTLEGEPNSKVTLNYLPGTALRGAIIAAWTRGRSDDIDADPHARSLFLEGKVRYLNAYPEAEQKQGRCLPTPLSWHREKGMESPILDFAHPECSRDQTKQWGSAGTPYRTRYGGDNSTYLLDVERHLAIHTTRSRIKGRSTTDEGDLFRYESLSEGQTFLACLLLDDAIVPGELTELLPKVSLLGGSRNAGYGRVSVSEIADVSRNWREFDYHLPDDKMDATAATLLSDTLLRDKHGQCRVDWREMERTLAAKVPGIRILTGDMGGGVFQRETIAAGFNRKWGLPLIQEHAFSMGSVFALSFADVSLPEQELQKAIQQLEDEGIGERRAEGFGRIGIGVLPHECWQNTGGAKTKREQAAGPLSVEGAALLRRMASKLVRGQLDRKVLQTSHNLEMKNPPTGSQIGRIRAVIRRELAKDPADIKASATADFLAALRDKAQKQYKLSTIDGQEALVWLTRRLERAETEQFGGGFKTKIGGQESEITSGGKLKAELSQEYTLREIDAILARAAKAGKTDG